LHVVFIENCVLRYVRAQKAGGSGTSTGSLGCAASAAPTDQPR